MQATKSEKTSASATFHAASASKVHGTVRDRVATSQTLGWGNASSFLQQYQKRWPSRVSRSELLISLSQLTIMCQAGVDLAEGIHQLADQCRHPALKRILIAVDRDVSSGQSFSDALRKHPQAFDEMIVSSIAAGEKSGNIPEVLERLTQLIRNDIRLRGTIIGMMIYPIVLCAVTLIVFGCMLFFVLPQFSEVFESMEKTPPAMTQTLLDLSEFLRSNALVLVVLLAASLIALWGARKSTTVLHARDRFVMHCIGLRHATRKLALGRMLRLLGAMLESGVPLLQAIRLSRSSSSNLLMKQLFDRIEQDVLNGRGLSGPLRTSEILPVGAAQMIGTAERSGNMGVILKTIGAFYESEGEEHIRHLVKIAEPLVIVVLGAFVGGIVLSIMLPMLDATSIHH